MANEQAEQANTTMVHYECYTCSMSATCVHNAVSDLSWLDHMATHTVLDHFGAWFWTVVPLQFDPTAVPG